MDGFGVNCFPNKNVYIGYHEKDKKKGFGKINWFGDEKIFIGFWNNNQQDGPRIIMIHRNIK